MAKVVRQRSRVVAIVGELVAHRVPQHVRVLRMVQRTGRAAPDRFLRSSGETSSRNDDKARAFAETIIAAFGPVSEQSALEKVLRRERLSESDQEFEQAREREAEIERNRPPPSPEGALPMLSGLSAALSAIIAMAIDADVPRAAIAAELRRFAGFNNTVCSVNGEQKDAGGLIQTTTTQ